MTKGDCFQAALFCAKSAPVHLREKVLVCHGAPVGTGPENLGHRYWHAWCEVPTPGGWLVVDISNDRPVSLKRANYYRLGQIEAGEVQRYTLPEAVEHADTSGNYGPWVSDEERERYL